MSEVPHLCCGLLFNETRFRVVLSRRHEHQTWTAGMLTGVGGRVNPDEMSRDAMRREFRAWP